jgi:hypothetical protein
MDLEKELTEAQASREHIKAAAELKQRNRHLQRELDLLRARASFTLQYGQNVPEDPFL